MVRTKKDLPWALWVGLPVGSFVFCSCVAAIGGPDTYRRWISLSEKGYCEFSTVLLLLPAIFLSGWMAWHWRDFPRRWLGVWVLILFLGSLYFAGEEASWGQHYFKWSTPEYWAAISDQGETNIHNVHGIFDQFPRGLLTAGAVISVIAPPLLSRRRRQWHPAESGGEWIWPTWAVFPSALLVLWVGLPQKFYGHYGAYDPRIAAWIDCMYLRGAHSELKEHFIAMFILMYIASMSYRFRRIRVAKNAPL